MCLQVGVSLCLVLGFSATGKSTLKNKTSCKFYSLSSALGLCPKLRWVPRKEWRCVYVFHMLIRKMCLDLQRDLAQFAGRKNGGSSDLYVFTSLPTSVNQWSRNLGFPLIVRAGRFFLSWTPKHTIDGTGGGAVAGDRNSQACWARWEDRTGSR